MAVSKKGRIVWDKTGERRFETGVSHGVLYVMGEGGQYGEGVAWNGLTSVTETPEGAEATPLYADNIKYLSLTSAETLKAGIEAFTFPDEFAACDGSLELTPGVIVGQQVRSRFGLCYRTEIGTDVNSEAGYKLHILYGCQAAPSERAYNTINESPEAITFSWDVTTTPVEVRGKKPTALLVIDSTKVTKTKLEKLENVLYGETKTNQELSTAPRLPLPDEIVTMLAG